ncbi:unnamed protein product, partial [Angiostrongylus costaricensis]|uniref:CUB domain-containing protein n=1 Tax=Angiostrongylus costaricensis TaxID=334426 RepID=A0A0R3PHL7_ANGCS
PYGCGETSKVTEWYQTLNYTVGWWDYHPDKNNDFYTLWFKVPAGSTIEVVFDNYTKNLALDGCVYAVYTHNIVPIIPCSRVYEANTILRYRTGTVYIIRRAFEIVLK